MAIAIPSVTKYITQSRKKTLTNTIGNYMSVLVNEVNDISYVFTGSNIIYAVPIKCVAVERGGTNPFGVWHQASNANQAYILVQYNGISSSYTYGYTFKDSVEYGLYPITQVKMDEKGSGIRTELDLSRPKNGLITTITSLENQKNSGFAINENIELKVLISSSENELGYGKDTCTLI